MLRISSLFFGFMLLGTTSAWAQTAPANTPAGGFGMLLPLVLIFVVFYFLIIRPQQKRMKQHREMVNNVKRGDKVLTAGGIYGTVSKIVDDKEAVIEIADGIEVRVAKATLSDVITKLGTGSDSSALSLKKQESEGKAKSPSAKSSTKK